MIGEGESISENTNTYGFFEVALNYGDAWDPDNRRPYDRFDVISQSNFGDKTRVGRLLIRGDLFSKLARRRTTRSRCSRTSTTSTTRPTSTAARASGRRSCRASSCRRRYALITRAQAFVILLGAVNSDFSFLADVANQERIREYDYGPGAGGAVELYLQRKNLPLLVARYRGSYIDVSNGSIYNSDDGRHRPRLDPRRPAAPAEARDPVGRASRSARTARCSSAAATTTSRAATSRPSSASRPPDDHPAQPRSPRLPGLELFPLVRIPLRPSRNSGLSGVRRCRRRSFIERPRATRSRRLQGLAPSLCARARSSPCSAGPSRSRLVVCSRPRPRRRRRRPRSA